MFRSKALRPIAGVVLITFTALTLQPLTAAAQLPSAPKRAQASSTTGEERFSRTLNEIHEILKEVVPQAAMPHRLRATERTAAGKPGEKVLQAVGPKMRLESERAKPLPGIDVTAKVKALRGKYKELKSLEGEVSKGFKETEKHIRDKNLPAEILARHEAAVAEYERRKAEFTSLMAAVETADDGKGSLAGALSSLGEFMAKYPNQKTHTPTDPNNLPWGSPKPVTRAPYTSPAQFKTSRLFGETVKVAQAGSLSGISLPTTVLPATPNAADLAATEDVQITQAIRDLAASLGNKPVPIYNWVRNNIQFIPSYGSIQGSDMTLQTKRGNSFDTASLLIALLRAANVPARYVYGTIEVPADKAMNWVGGVTVPQAAMNLMGQGGIPNIGVAQGGQVKAIRLEHVWVEAFVDYVPSRGAVNKNPNTWVPLDASFKQYQFTQGMNIATNVPFDVDGLITQIRQGTSVNEAEGWVQNVNQAQVQQAQTNYLTQATNYVNSQKPTATLGDVLGTQTVVPENRPILLGTLPYIRIATGAKFAAVPANLQWKYRTALTDAYQVTEYASIGQSTAMLAGKKISISFVPAAQADLDLINSFLPQPHTDGTPIQLSELPSSVPGYLIHVNAEIRVDGQLVNQSTTSTTMGQMLVQTTAIFSPASQSWEEGEPNQPVAGEYHAIALNLQGTSVAQFVAMKSKLEATKAKLDQFRQNPTNSTPMQNLTKEELTGDLLYVGILSYFASADGSDQLTARASGSIVDYRLPSYGAFTATAQPHFFFGIVRRVTFPGVTMDVDRILHQVEAKDYDRAKKIDYMRQVGAAGSAVEHAVPEELFIDASACNALGTPNPDPSKPACPQAVSAVKALGIAAAQGQRIYTLNQANQAFHSTILSQLTISADVKSEIANALASGKEVTLHQADITVSGWTGSGYVIIDPDTGAGAYKIAGGANGAILILTGIIILALLLVNLAALMALGPFGLAIFSVGLQLALPLIIAGIAAMNGYATVCVWSMSIVFSAIWDLFHFAQPGGSLLMNALSGIWFAVTASAAFVICGVE